MTEEDAMETAAQAEAARTEERKKRYVAQRTEMFLMADTAATGLGTNHLDRIKLAKERAEALWEDMQRSGMEAPGGGW